MARRPNYSFERNERTKAKAAKRQAKRDAQAALRHVKEEEPGEPSGQPGTPSGQDAPAQAAPESSD